MPFVLGRPERLRRLHEVDGHRARRHEISGLVARHGVASRLSASDLMVRLKADTARYGQMKESAMSKASDSAGFTLIELLIVLALISILAAMGVVQYKNGVRAHAGERAAHGPLPHAGRDRPVLCRQEQVSGLARHARERRIHAEDPGGSDHAFGRHLADRARPSPTRAIRRRSPGSTTSRAAPRARPWTDPRMPTGKVFDFVQATAPLAAGSAASRGYAAAAAGWRLRGRLKSARDAAGPPP